MENNNRQQGGGLGHAAGVAGLVVLGAVAIASTLVSIRERDLARKEEAKEEAMKVDEYYQGGHHYKVYQSPNDPTLRWTKVVED